jgi:hypothetical protein
MTEKLTRRQFIHSSAALTAASTFTIVKAESVRGTAANSMVEVGWIGLGGRGTRDAYLLEKTGKAKIVAVADYFQLTFRANKTGILRFANPLKSLMSGHV